MSISDSSVAEAREQIVRLTHDYAFANDHFRVSEVVDLFVPGGVFDMSEIGLTVYTGHDEIRDFFEREKRALTHVMHVTSNHRIDLEPDGLKASGTVYYVAIGVVRRSGEVNQSRGYYKDSYLLTEAGWRFEARVGHSLIPWTPARADSA